MLPWLLVGVKIEKESEGGFFKNANISFDAP